MDESCCQNPDIKIINGNRTCIICGLVHTPVLVHDWIEFNPKNIVLRKSIYNRNAHVKNKLKNINLSSKKIEEFMNAWSPVEQKLKNIFDKRFPKLNYFINKMLETLGFSNRIPYKISSALSFKYEIIWKEIV